MSIVDELDLNGKFRLVLMATIDITDPERHEKSLNSCNAISGAQMRKLLAYFNLNDVALRELGNLEHIWGVFQGVRKKRGTDEYIRDQIQIVINVGETRTARIYVRGVRDRKEEVLAELEAVRGAADLIALLGPAEGAEISRRKFTPRVVNGKKPDGNRAGGARNYADHGGERNQPFNDLRDRMNNRDSRDKGRDRDRRRQERLAHG